ncbi:MAG TPA: hypothetical protein VKA85_10400 [Candidatus Limnocylindrales bacterium]|nr:hypothetical protein [Candidatus Limnocylindrales bacterium]
MQATRQAPLGTYSASTIGIVAALAVSVILGLSVALTGGARFAPATGPAAAPQVVSSAQERAEAAAVIAKFRTGDYDRISVKAAPVETAPGNGQRGAHLRIAK